MFKKSSVCVCVCVFFPQDKYGANIFDLPKPTFMQLHGCKTPPADLRVGSDSLHIPWVTVLGVRTGKTTRYQLKKVDNIAPWKFLKFNGEFTPEIWYLEDDPCCSFFWFMYFFSG